MAKHGRCADMLIKRFGLFEQRTKFALVIFHILLYFFFLGIYSGQLAHLPLFLFQLDQI